ncbi:hypothetical protein HDV05_003145 [Chytridiales sp. JEL 0842]|nr:hypothetical protein HDV05_003145 [Chytridiales sp. JEL 0842]
MTTVQAAQVNDLFARQDALTTTNGSPAATATFSTTTTSTKIVASPSATPAGPCGECTTRVKAAVTKCGENFLNPSTGTGGSYTAAFVEGTNCLCSEGLAALSCATGVTGTCTLSDLGLAMDLQVFKNETEAFCKPGPVGKRSCVEASNALNLEYAECAKKPGPDQEKCQCNAVSPVIADLKSACLGASTIFSSVSQFETVAKNCEAKGIKSGSVKSSVAFGAVSIFSLAAALFV